MKPFLKTHADKFRFALIGGINTLLDFSILFFLVQLGVDKLVANFFSTSLAFIFSFFANKSFTFQAKGGNVKRQFVLFLIVTLFGLWVLQPLMIYAVGRVFMHSHWSAPLILLVSKLAATVVSLTWNYIFYSRIVFKKDEM